VRVTRTSRAGGQAGNVDVVFDGKGQAEQRQALAGLLTALDAWEGKFDEARGYFQDALLRKGKNRITVETELDLTELELHQGNGKTAAETAREVSELVTAMRGRLPYSNFVGLASLKLGRAFDMLGDKSQARHAYGTAVENLSNTVDDDHPALVQARELLAKN